MKFSMKKVLLGLLAIALAGAGQMGAQSATNGAIGGSVYDTAGAVVPGAEVTATNNATGQTLKAKAAPSGGYRILEVTPGEYTVTITADGYQTYKENHVVVTVGGLNDISPKLSVGSVSSIVEVTDTTPELQTQSNDFSTTIDQSQIDNLPINGRRWSNFALLTPGVVSNSDGFGLLSFRGVSFLLNNSTVDGMDNNQAYFSEERGRTRAAYSISQAAVQEFQVNTSNFSAEFGRAAGGVINTVTKSGTNKLHGELFYYDRDNQWGAANPYTQIVNQQADGSFTAVNYKPKDWRKQWGFGIGGPLIKDKLFWFYSYDQSRRNFPGTARASDPSDTFAKADATLSPGYTCSGGKYAVAPGATNPATSPGSQYACSLANALNLGSGASAYQAGAAYYAQGLQIIQSFLGAVPRNSDQVLNFPRIDWQINNANHAVFEYNRLRYSAPAGLQTQASNFYGRASFGNDYVKTDFGIFRLVTTLSPSLVNEFKFQYGRDFEYETSQNPLPNELPLAQNRFARPPDVQIGYYFDLAGFDIGKPYLLDRKALPDERRIQGSEGITWSHGKHTVKAGIDINRAFDRIDNLYEENGSFSYDYQWDFIADYLHATEGLGGSNYAPQYYTYTQGYGNGKMSISTTDYAGYLTDDWRITPRLTLTAGLRYEYEYVPGNPTVNTGNSYIAAISNVSTAATALPQTASRPDDRNNIAPRVGFAWDVYGDGKTSIRGGYGMYFGRMINSNIALAYSNSGSDKAQFALTNYKPTLATGTTCPLLGGDINPAAGPPSATGSQTACSLQTPTVAYLDPHMQNPQVHEFDLALQQNIGWNTVFSLTYMASLGRELPSVFDTNTPGYDHSTTGVVTTETYTVCNTCAVNVGGGVALNPLPRGGKPAPLADGSKHTYKFYTGSRPNPYYYNIYKVQSEVNSNYHALAAQITKRYSNSLSIMSSFTWAHAMDYNPYLSTSYGSTAYLPLDPNDQRQDYGNSNLNVKHRFIFSAHYNPNFNVKGWKKWVADDWGLSPIIQIQDGLPYSAATSGSKATGGALSGPLGVGGAARLPKFDAFGNLENARNNYTQPGTASFDVRLSKNFSHDVFGDNVRLEVFAELFNVFNHQNITQVSNGAYLTCNGPAGASGQANACPALTSVPSGQAYLVFVPNFGQNKNSNSNTIYSPRQVQIAARLHF